MVKAAERGTALIPLKCKDLDLVFSLQHERVVAPDNTVSFANRSWQLERTKLRGTLAGCRVVVHEHLNGTLSITFGRQLVGRYQKRGCGNDAAMENDKSRRFPPRLGKVRPESSLTFPHSHSPYYGIDIELVKPKPDISLAKKTGNLNLLTTDFELPHQKSCKLRPGAQGNQGRSGDCAAG